MGCPACGEALVAGQDRCLACGAAVGPATEGALAPDLMSAPGPARLERIRDVPAFKKREPTWKDEVRERMKHRRRRVEELPLFRDPPPTAPAHDEEAATDEVAVEETPPPPEPVEFDAAPFAHADPPEPDPSPEAGFVFDGPFTRHEPAPPPAPERGPVIDLPLRDEEPADPLDALEPEAPPPLEFPEPEPPELSQPAPVERPAFVGERLKAAAVDTLTLVAIAAVVVYFAARAAHVSPLGLLPAWPYVAGFLALFALAYAAFFTGLTGQTLGKMLLHLRVVDTAGSPPGHWRAAIRAALGTIGSVALIGVAPMLVDPARRALHDRLLRTRVVRS